MFVWALFREEILCIFWSLRNRFPLLDCKTYVFNWKYAWLALFHSSYTQLQGLFDHLLARAYFGKANVTNQLVSVPYTVGPWVGHFDQRKPTKATKRLHSGSVATTVAKRIIGVRAESERWFFGDDICLQSWLLKKQRGLTRGTAGWSISVQKGLESVHWAFVWWEYLDLLFDLG